MVANIFERRMALVVIWPESDDINLGTHSDTFGVILGHDWMTSNMLKHIPSFINSACMLNVRPLFGFLKFQYFLFHRFSFSSLSLLLLLHPPLFIPILFYLSLFSILFFFSLTLPLLSFSHHLPHPPFINPTSSSFFPYNFQCITI